MAEILRASWESPQPDVVRAVARALGRGGVAVLPTDTVYGVSQSVLANPLGAEGLFAIKRRPHSKSIPWLVPDIESLDAYGQDVPAYARRLAQAFWPGGLTLVVSASHAVPEAYLGPGRTIALRMPASPIVIAAARELGCPLATTSANTSGRPAPDSFARLEPRILREAAVAVDDGAVHSLVPSTVVVCTGETPQVTREGAVSGEQLGTALAGVV